MFSQRLRDRVVPVEQLLGSAAVASSPFESLGTQQITQHSGEDAIDSQGFVALLSDVLMGRHGLVAYSATGSPVSDTRCHRARVG